MGRKKIPSDAFVSVLTTELSCQNCTLAVLLQFGRLHNGICFFSFTSSRLQGKRGQFSLSWGNIFVSLHFVSDRLLGSPLKMPGETEKACLALLFCSTRKGKWTSIHPTSLQGCWVSVLHLQLLSAQFFFFSVAPCDISESKCVRSTSW